MQLQLKKNNNNFEGKAEFSLRLKLFKYINVLIMKVNTVLIIKYKSLKKNLLTPNYFNMYF